MERVTHRLVGWSVNVLVAYVVADRGRALWSRDRPALSLPGPEILSLSIVLMPGSARAKLRVAHAVGSAALRAEVQQASLFAYLSAIALAGVALNALLGWWWADPLAAIAIVPIIAKEGFDGIRGRQCDG